MDEGFTYSDLAMYAAADDTSMTSLLISDHVLLWYNQSQRSYIAVIG